jgi:hypothetical protein
MTTITYIHGHRRSPTHARGSGLLHAPATLLLRLRDQWRRRQAEKMLESLPSDIRKDIGWPSIASGPDAR